MAMLFGVFLHIPSISTPVRTSKRKAAAGNKADVTFSTASYRGYEDAMYLFKQYLNGYAYQYLDEKDSKLFDKLYGEKNIL
jgi:hypothetical protein